LDVEVKGKMGEEVYETPFLAERAKIGQFDRLSAISLLTLA